MSESIYKIGVIGLGSMGTGFMKHLAESDRGDDLAQGSHAYLSVLRSRSSAT
jgi:3-hydroxyisobutyrate dehydrogenase-like beta-hydroxyacid dehydrogenase